MDIKCVCMICFKPNDIWFDFLSKFTKYDIYVIIDDNSKDYKEEFKKFNNINIIQIIDEECKKNGFINMNFTINKIISGWEKAIYYFSSINTKYNKIWFFEDDVFFYNEQTLLNIDFKYNDSDLLSTYCGENTSGHKNNWHWSKIDIKFTPPYYYAMVCCVRMSEYLLSKIKEYANEYNTLFFLEALFPTLCKKHNLQYDIVKELKNIVYRKNYDDKVIDKNNLFHPVKDLTKHVYYREMLIKKYMNK